jgi:hypothetical protein
MVDAGDVVGYGTNADVSKQLSFLTGRLMLIEPISIRDYSPMPINDRHENSCQQ